MTHNNLYKALFIIIDYYNICSIIERIVTKRPWRTLSPSETEVFPISSSTEKTSVNLPKSDKSVNQITIDLWPFS